MLESFTTNTYDQSKLPISETFTSWEDLKLELLNIIYTKINTLLLPGDIFSAETIFNRVESYSRFTSTPNLINTTASKTIFMNVINNMSKYQPIDLVEILTFDELFFILDCLLIKINISLDC